MIYPFSHFYKPIPYELGYRAYSGISFSPERRAKSITDDFKQETEEIYNEIKALAEKNGKEKYFNSDFQYFIDGYRKRYVSWLQTMSTIVSTMIAGPSNFPVRTMQKRNDWEHKKLTDLLGFRAWWLKKIKLRYRPEHLKPIKAGADTALESLKTKLADLEKSQEYYKKINKAVRSKNNVEELKKIGLSVSQINKLLQPDYAGRIGIAPYVLQNNNQNMQRIRQRIKEEESYQEKKQAGNVEYTFDGGTITQNFDINRWQIFFPGKPSDEVRKELKRNAFKWSPFYGAWIRQQNTFPLHRLESISILPNIQQVESDKTEQIEPEEETIVIDDENFEQEGADYQPTESELKKFEPEEEPAPQPEFIDIAKNTGWQPSNQGGIVKQVEKQGGFKRSRIILTKTGAKAKRTLKFTTPLGENSTGLEENYNDLEIAIMEENLWLKMESPTLSEAENIEIAEKQTPQPEPAEPGKFSPTKLVAIDRIFTKPEVFQNRNEKFSQATFDKIVSEGYDKSQEPIYVWEDPGDKKYYILSGHSRFAAAQFLHNRDNNLSELPVKQFYGTFDDAIDYATIRSNRESNKEGLKADINAYLRAVSRGYNKTELLKYFNPESYLNKLRDLSYLNPNGKFLEYMDTPQEQSFPYLSRNATWVGELKRQFPNLSNAHESEMFDFLYKQGTNKLLLTKDAFTNLVRKKAESMFFDPEQALNLGNAASTAAAKNPGLEHLNQLRADMETRQQIINKNRDLIARARVEGKTERIKEFEAEISGQTARIIELATQIKKAEHDLAALERNTMFDLFSEPEKDIILGAEQKNNNMIIAFHGSKRKWEKISTLGENRSGDDVYGAYFTSDLENAKGYSRNNFVYKVEIKLNNPLIIDCKGRNYNVCNEIQTITYNYKGEIIKKETDLISAEQTANQAKIDGFDGVIFNNIKDNSTEELQDNESTTYVVFNEKDFNIIEILDFRKNKQAEPQTEKSPEPEKDIKEAIHKRIKSLELSYEILKDESILKRINALKLSLDIL